MSGPPHTAITSGESSLAERTEHGFNPPLLSGAIVNSGVASGVSPADFLSASRGDYVLMMDPPGLVDKKEKCVRVLNLICGHYLGDLPVVTKETCDKFSGYVDPVTGKKHKPDGKINGLVLPSEAVLGADIEHIRRAYSDTMRVGDATSSIRFNSIGQAFESLVKLTVAFFAEIKFSKPQKSKVVADKHDKTNHRIIFFSWVVSQILRILKQKTTTMQTIRNLENVLSTIQVFRETPDLCGRRPAPVKRFFRGMLSIAQMTETETRSDVELLAKTAAHSEATWEIIDEMRELLRPTEIQLRQTEMDSLISNSVLLIDRITEILFKAIFSHEVKDFHRSMNNLASIAFFGSHRITVEDKFFRFVFSAELQDFWPCVFSKKRFEEFLTFRNNNSNFKSDGALRQLYSDRKEFFEKLGLANYLSLQSDHINFSDFVYTNHVQFIDECSSLLLLERLAYQSKSNEIKTYFDSDVPDSELAKSLVSFFRGTTNIDHLDRMACFGCKNSKSEVVYPRLTPTDSTASSISFCSIPGARPIFSFGFLFATEDASVSESSARGLYMDHIAVCINLRDMLVFSVTQLARIKGASTRLGPVGSISGLFTEATVLSHLQLLLSKVADPDGFILSLSKMNSRLIRHTISVGPLHEFEPELESAILLNSNVSYLKAVAIAVLASRNLKAYEQLSNPSVIARQIREGGEQTLRTYKEVNFAVRSNLYNDLPPPPVDVIFKVADALEASGAVERARVGRERLSGLETAQMGVTSDAEGVLLHEKNKKIIDAIGVPRPHDEGLVKAIEFQGLVHEVHRRLCELGVVEEHFHDFVTIAMQLVFLKLAANTRVTQATRLEQDYLANVRGKQNGMIRDLPAILTAILSESGVPVTEIMPASYLQLKDRDADVVDTRRRVITPGRATVFSDSRVTSVTMGVGEGYLPGVEAVDDVVASGRDYGSVDDGSDRSSFDGEQSYGVCPFRFLTKDQIQMIKRALKRNSYAMDIPVARDVMDMSEEDLCTCDQFSPKDINTLCFALDFAGPEFASIISKLNGAFHPTSYLRTDYSGDRKYDSDDDLDSGYS